MVNTKMKGDFNSVQYGHRMASDYPLKQFIYSNTENTIESRSISQTFSFSCTAFNFTTALL